jgi:hypothetical protein
MRRQIYGEEYLCVPDENDIKNITQLHREVQ